MSLSQDTSVWWSGDIFSAMRATLNADRVKEHDEAHAKDETVTNHILRAEDVVDYGTRGGAKAIGLDSAIGSIEVGKKADLVLVKNDNSPVSFPILHPYGHVVFQANRGDVHTVLVNGKVVKHEHKLVGVDLAKAKASIESTIEYLKAEHGPQEWENGMHPEIPEHETLNNPYTYRDDVSAWKESDTSWKPDETDVAGQPLTPTRCGCAIGVAIAAPMAHPCPQGGPGGGVGEPRVRSPGLRGSVSYSPQISWATSTTRRSLSHCCCSVRSLPSLVEESRTGPTGTAGRCR